MTESRSEAERRLRSYPISLRESARAVFGDRYAGAEKRALAATGEQAPPSPR